MKKLPKNLAWLRKIPEEDYEFFFEEKILERGANYFESGNVERLALTRSGEIVGKVRGTRIYYVSISSCGDGDIDPDCSCPYESNCKHAAAVLMAFEEHCAKGKDLEILADDDPFLLRMNAELWDFDEDGSLSPVRREELHDFLKNMSKKEIIALIEEWQEQIPEVARDLLERRKLQSGNVQSILIDLQAEIDAVTEEPGWRNHWSSDGFTPDYGGIRRRLRLLLDQDQADGILSISGHFFESAIEQVGMSDDEGETAMEVQGCIPLFLEALEKSSLSGAKRLIWAVDKLLADDFGVMDELRVVVERDYPPQDWLTLAEFLKELMAEFPEDPHQEHRSGDFQRKMISRWLKLALEKSGRSDQVLSLLEQEARGNNAHEELVSWLIEHQRYDEAQTRIIEGLAAVEDKWPGIGNGLRKAFLSIRRQHKDWPVVAAFWVEEVMNKYDDHAYRECRKAAQKLGLWEKVSKHLHTYWVEGKSPEKADDWPLPPTGLPVNRKSREENFPRNRALISVAILEKDPEAVLRWYEALRQLDAWRREYYDPMAIASAVKGFAPQRSIDIWREVVESAISTVDPKTYREAKPVLIHIRDTYRKIGQPGQWQIYLETLRSKHKRKRRLMEVLAEVG